METLFHASPFTSYVCWIKNQRSLFVSRTRCVYRKLDSAILVVKATENWV
jgi:hypothetical protein